MIPQSYAHSLLTKLGIVSNYQERLNGMEKLRFQEVFVLLKLTCPLQQRFARRITLSTVGSASGSSLKIAVKVVKTIL